MTDTELLINSIVIMFVVGFLVGAVLVDVLFGEPARKERDALRLAEARRRSLDAEDRLSRAVWRREHLGTPYIARDDTHSRKVKPLEVVQ